MIEHIGWCLAENADRFRCPPAKIRGQNFDVRRCAVLPERADAVREVLCAPVTQIVSVHGRHHDVTQTHTFDGFGQTLWFCDIHATRSTVSDIAERTATRAHVTEDHERRGSVSETLTKVGAARLLADGIEIALPKNFF